MKSAEALAAIVGGGASADARVEWATAVARAQRLLEHYNIV